MPSYTLLSPLNSMKLGCQLCGKSKGETGLAISWNICAYAMNSLDAWQYLWACFKIYKNNNWSFHYVNKGESQGWIQLAFLLLKMPKA